MAAYNEQYQKYLESLPEEERVALGGATVKKEESPPTSPDKKGSSKAQVCLTEVDFVGHLCQVDVLRSLGGFLQTAQTWANAGVLF